MLPRRAFTLVELLIVVSIIAILAIIAIVSMSEASVRSKIARVRSDHHTIAGALQAYAADQNTLPAGDDSYIGALTTPIAYATSDQAFRDQFPTRKLEALGWSEKPSTYYALCPIQSPAAGS